MSLDANGERAVLVKRAQFKEGSAAESFVKGQSSVPMPSLAGLPAGSFLVAGALNVDPKSLETISNAMMDLVMSMPTVKEGLSEANMAEMTAETKAANALMSGYGFTVGIGSPMSGLINAVARYDVSDSKEWMGHGKKLYEGSSAEAVAKSSGMPVKYMYTSGAEEYGGVQIDTVKMELNAPAEADEMTEQEQMQAMMAQQMMGMMLGPEMMVRMATPSKDQVLLTMGGGAENMERAINVVKGRGTALADMESVKLAGQSLPANRFAEAHLDLTQLMPMMMMFMGGMGGGEMPSGPEGGAVPISMSASTEADTLRADLVVPTASVKALIEMAMQMGGGPRPSRMDDGQGDEYEWDEDVEEDF